VALIQGNVPGEMKWSGKHQPEILGAFLALSERAAAHTPAPMVILWPETATTDNDATYDAYNGSLNVADVKNLGYLFETKAIVNARVFYCLSGTTAKGVGTTGFYASERTYENYSVNGVWPAFYPGDGTARCRIGYTYFPQPGTRTLASRTIASKPAFTPPGMATKSLELSARYSIATDLVYRMDMITHRSGLKRGLGLNALFGDMHVQFEHDPSYFDTVNVWNGSENGQTGGGIEDEGDNFRWLMMIVTRMASKYCKMYCKTYCIWPPVKSIQPLNPHAKLPTKEYRSLSP
jgi:hypothetical protein